MQSGGKIALIIIAFYLITGIYNYSGTGTFITPYFLNYIILSIVAVVLAILNKKNTNHIVLIIYAIGILSLTFTNGLSLTILKKWFGISSEVAIPEIAKILAVIIFHIALVVGHVKMIRRWPESRILKLIALLIPISLVGVLGNFFWMQTIGLSLYFLCFVMFWNYYRTEKYNIFDPLSYQFLIFLFIENIRLISFG